MKDISKTIESMFHTVLIISMATLLFFLIWKATLYVANYFFKDKSHEIKCRWRIVFFIQIFLFLVLIDSTIKDTDFYQDLARIESLVVIFSISNIISVILLYWVIVGYAIGFLLKNITNKKKNILRVLIGVIIISTPFIYKYVETYKQEKRIKEYKVQYQNNPKYKLIKEKIIEKLNSHKETFIIDNKTGKSRKYTMSDELPEFYEENIKKEIEKDKDEFFDTYLDIMIKKEIKEKEEKQKIFDDAVKEIKDKP